MPPPFTFFWQRSSLCDALPRPDGRQYHVAAHEGPSPREDQPGMTAAAPAFREHGNAYNIFILVLTIFSLALMALQLLPLDPETRVLVTFYDNAICVIFLI